MGQSSFICGLSTSAIKSIVSLETLGMACIYVYLGSCLCSFFPRGDAAISEFTTSVRSLSTFTLLLAMPCCRLIRADDLRKLNSPETNRESIDQSSLRRPMNPHAPTDVCPLGYHHLTNTKNRDAQIYLLHLVHLIFPTFSMIPISALPKACTFTTTASTTSTSPPAAYHPSPVQMQPPTSPVPQHEFISHGLNPIDDDLDQRSTYYHRHGLFNNDRLVLGRHCI